MHPLAVFLQTCNKDVRLSCFWALICLGPLPVRQGKIAKFLNLDRRTVNEGLLGLQTLMLVICRGGAHQTDWQLSPAGLKLAACFGQVVAELPDPEAGEQAALPMYKKRTSEPMYKNSTSGVIESTMYKKRTLEPVESESDNNINSDSITSAPEKNSDAETMRRFGVVLKQGGVFPNVATGLLDELIERPDYLPHLLGHLAIVKSGKAKDELGYRSGAVYLRDCIQAHSPADLLPPADLDFEQALAWAINGGVTQAELIQRAAAEAEREAALEEAERERNEQKRAEAARAATPPTELEKIWLPALAQLQMEMPRSTFDTWVRETQLLSVDNSNNPAVYTIGAPNAYAKDWLENRLTSSVRRTLSNVLGINALDVHFAVTPKPPAGHKD